MWQALEKLYEEGETKSIGVGNFGIKHIEELREFARQPDRVPWSQQKQIVEY
ncbi:Fc.00g105660.m01.CDS01 [Cosmosporella sp. VM-42]